MQLRTGRASCVAPVMPLHLLLARSALHLDRSRLNAVHRPHPGAAFSQVLPLPTAIGTRYPHCRRDAWVPAYTSIVLNYLLRGRAAKPSTCTHCARPRSHARSSKTASPQTSWLQVPSAMPSHYLSASPYRHLLVKAAYCFKMCRNMSLQTTVITS